MDAVVDFKIRHSIKGAAVVQLKLETKGWIKPFPVAQGALAALILELQTGRASFDLGSMEVYVRPFSMVNAAFEDFPA